MSQNQGPGQNEDRSGTEMEGWPLQTGWLGLAVVATNPLVFHNPYATGNSQDQCAALKKKWNQKQKHQKCKVAGGIYFIFIKDAGHNFHRRWGKWKMRGWGSSGWWDGSMVGWVLLVDWVVGGDTRGLSKPWTAAAFGGLGICVDIISFFFLSSIFCGCEELFSQWDPWMWRGNLRFKGMRRVEFLLWRKFMINFGSKAGIWQVNMTG